MCTSFFIENVVAQTTIFVIASTILLFATRPFVNKFAKTDNTSKTFSIEGKTGKVINDIDPIEGSGQIKIGGEVWAAKSSDGTQIQKDTNVIVEKIDGVKAIVSRI